MKFCGGCGAPQVPGDLFCQRCGRAYPTGEQAAPAGVVAPPPRQWAQPPDEPFPPWMMAVAVAAVLVAPFISLIVALVMRSSEPMPSRQAFLKNWAIWSGVWLFTGFFLFGIVACSAMSSSQGGGGFGP